MGEKKEGLSVFLILRPGGFHWEVGGTSFIPCGKKNEGTNLLLLLLLLFVWSRPGS